LAATLCGVALDRCTIEPLAPVACGDCRAAPALVVEKKDFNVACMLLQRGAAQTAAQQAAAGPRRQECAAEQSKAAGRAGQGGKEKPSEEQEPLIKLLT